MNHFDHNDYRHVAEIIIIMIIVDAQRQTWLCPLVYSGVLTEQNMSAITEQNVGVVTEQNVGVVREQNVGVVTEQNVGVETKQNMGVKTVQNVYAENKTTTKHGCWN